MSAKNVAETRAFWSQNFQPCRTSDPHKSESIFRAFPGNRWRALWESNTRSDGIVCETRLPLENQGVVFDGRQRSPGSRGADGGTLGTNSSEEPDSGLDFSAPVPPGGYSWWYVDALSDDGAYGLSIIGFIGSVFSPYYTLARYRAEMSGTSVNPRNHCAINVALYSKNSTRWAMTERGQKQCSISRHQLSIGPSTMSWDGTALTIHFDEIAVPFPRRIKGKLRLLPSGISNEMHSLNPQGEHLWWPIAPVSRVEVELDHPTIRWSGNAYFDHNRGAEPIAEGFRTWTWSRAPLKAGAAVFYDGIRKNGDLFNIGRQFDITGKPTTLDPPPEAKLKPTLWRIPRSARSESSTPPRLIETLEDTPFYARSSVAMRIAGEDVLAVHESMSVDRFNTKVVQLMLPFRMPRRA
jgi:carotenoid 1,2-hydratase